MIFLGNGATEGKYKDEEKYLDISKLKEFEQITTIAYVHDVSVGRTKICLLYTSPSPRDA